MSTKKRSRTTRTAVGGSLERMVRLVPIECPGCSKIKRAKGDMTPAHVSHFECSGCRQRYERQTIHDHNPKSIYYFEAKFCPACGARIEPNAELSDSRENNL